LRSEGKRGEASRGSKDSSCRTRHALADLDVVAHGVSRLIHRLIVHLVAQ
jgi:hypothetical protein